MLDNALKADDPSTGEIRFLLAVGKGGIPNDCGLEDKILGEDAGGCLAGTPCVSLKEDLRPDQLSTSTSAQASVSKGTPYISFPRRHLYSNSEYCTNQPQLFQ